MHHSPLHAPLPGSPAPATSAPAAVGSPNYYSPPAFDYQPIPSYDHERYEGSYGLGIAVGLLFSLLGILLAAIFGKQQTKRGAVHGFLIRLGITLLIVVFSIATY